MPLVVTLLWSLGARAAEVVWLSPPDDAERTSVATAAHAEGPPLELLDLRAAATRWTDGDDQTLRDLAQVLAQARSYESVLDGELLILRDLGQPVARVSALRDATDRNVLYTALLYEGFAVNRYFAQALATSFEAAPYRIQVVGQTVEKAWLDAAALEPERKVTAYEIGEAPQRAAYEEYRARFASLAPATLTPVDLPGAARIIVDGRPTEISPSGNLKVRPGRHLVHAEIEGRIICRWQIEVTPAGDAPLLPRVGETVWRKFVAALETSPQGSEPRVLAAEIVELVEAMGGEVWVASPTGPRWSLTRAGMRPLPVEEEISLPPPRHTQGGRWSGGALAGWLGSKDFYAQAPSDTPRTVATVNAPTVGGWLEGARSLGSLTLGGGADVLVPVGPYHVALSGQDRVRPRPVLYTALGLGPVDVAFGWLFPFHIGTGAHMTLLLPKKSTSGVQLALRGAGWLGLPLSLHREDGTRWEGKPVFTATAGLGLAR